MASTSLEFVITAVDKASGVIKGVGDAGEKAGGKFEKFKTGANVAMAAVGVAAVKFGSDSVQAYQEAEQSQAALERAYESFPALANTNIDALRKLNSEIQAKTGYDDDAAAAAQATLAQFGLTGSQIAKLTPLMADYAAKTGKDIGTAAEDMGKAILGQGKALKNVGVDFTDTGDAAGNFDQLISGLDEKVGGFAETMGDTAAGKAQILQATFGDLQEQVGAGLTPALTTLTTVATGVLNWLTQTPGAMTAVAIALGVMAVAWAAMTLAASPWLLIGVAIAAVIAGIVLVIKNWSTVVETLKRAWGAVVGWFKGTIIEPLKTAWTGVTSWFSTNVAKVGDFFSDLVDHIRTIFKNVANLITFPFRSAFNGLAKIWNSTVGKIEVNIPSWVPGIGGKSFAVPDLPEIPAFAGGVRNFRGGYALVGEKGPEVVGLPRGSDVYPTGQVPRGGDVYNIYEATSARATALAVSRQQARKWV